MELPRGRNYGIDALRVLSMYMVLILHIAGVGGALSGLKAFSASYEAAWFLETMAFCAVNCYALISGYVGYQGKFKLSNLHVLWIEVVLYCVIIAMFFIAKNPDAVGRTQLVSSLFPVLSEQYWYFTAYFALFFFTPALNHLIKTLPREKAKAMLIFLVVIFSFLPTLRYADVFKTSEGYSPLWLAILYLIGAYVRKYNLDQGRNRLALIGQYLLFVFITWVAKLLIEIVSAKKFGGVYYGDYLLKYTSPTMLGASIALLLLFAGMKIQGNGAKKIVGILGTASFGVYLIHTNPLIWSSLLSGAFNSLGKYNVWIIVVHVLISAVVIYLACAAVDYGRKKLFDLLRVRKLAQAIEIAERKVWDKLLSFARG